MSLERRQWNFSAVMASMVLLSTNIVAGWAVLNGKMSWEQWAAAVGAVNGVALGWVARSMGPQ